jgi:ABC-type transporter Mla MlaB component
MLRMREMNRTVEAVTLAVDGRVAGDSVRALEREGTRLLAEAGRLILQLDDTQYIDAEGLALLRRWRGRHLRLCGGSAFVRALLRRHGWGDDDTLDQPNCGSS